jgi:plasmid replication initiation protein
VTLTWSIPSVIPEDFRRPISVQIQIVENNIYRDRITLVNEETSHTFTIDPAKKYRYIVKLVGTFTEENQETGRTSTVTSEGVIVNVE